MCGIILGKRRDNHPVAKAVLKRFNKQRGRGVKGFGYAPINNGRLAEVERFETEADMEKSLKNRKEPFILFHHRQPTSTPNFRDMAHPIEVENKELGENKFIVVHNGVIRNEDTLKKKHEKLGYTYTTHLIERVVVETRSGKQETKTESFNDSEAFAIELARYLAGKSDEIDCLGTIAFIAFEVDKKDKLIRTHYGHNAGNPLKIEDNNALFFIKSEGEGEVVPIDTIFTIDESNGELSSKKVDIGRVGYTPTKTESSPGQQRMGFGANYQDPDDEFGAVARFMKRETNVVPGSVKSAVCRDGKLDWGEEPLHGVPVIQIGPDGELDYSTLDDSEESYYNSDEYINDLYSQKQAIEEDIKTCIAKIKNSSTDDTYNEEYLEDLETQLENIEIQMNDWNDERGGGGAMVPA